MSGLSAAQVSSRQTKNKSISELPLPLFVRLTVLTFDMFGPNRRKCWDGSSLFCPSARRTRNHSRSKCYTKPNSGEAEGRGRHCGHSWQGWFLSCVPHVLFSASTILDYVSSGLRFSFVHTSCYFLSFLHPVITFRAD